MDVTIIGKALTPISHERLHLLPLSSREDGFSKKRIPYSKRYSDLKSMQIYHDSMKREQHWGQWEPKFEKTRLNLSPIFRNMTLSETYDFARAQLKQYPMRGYPRRMVRTPNLTFPKVHESDPNEETTTEKQSEELQTDVVAASSRSEAQDTIPVVSSMVDAEIHSSKVQRRTKSVTGNRKSRKKSARRKRKSPAVNIGSSRGITLSRYMCGETITPMQTSTSMPSRLNTIDSYKRTNDQAFTNLAPQRIKPLTYGTRRTTSLPRQTRQALDKSIDCKVDDMLLSSLGMGLPDISM